MAGRQKQRSYSISTAYRKWTVSGIIKEFRREDFDADLLRQVALNLKDRGLDIQSFAPLVRLRHVLEEEVGWILSGVGLGQGVT